MLCFVDRASRYNSGKWPTWRKIRFSYMFISILYMFREVVLNLYWYNWFSWWWARGCSKHVENWNKHIRKKNCASSWSFTRTDLTYSIFYASSRCTGYIKRPKNALWFMDIILFHSGYQHVSATRFAIFRVVRTRIQLELKCVQIAPSFKNHVVFQYSKKNQQMH
jgi:hypothetical protein